MADNEESSRKNISINYNVGTDKLQYQKRKIRLIKLSQERTVNFSQITFTNENVIHIPYKQHSTCEKISK